MRRVALLLVLACSCGRIGFRARDDAGGTGGDAIPIDGPADTTTLQPDAGSSIRWVQTFAARHPGGGPTDTFTATAAAAGDVIAMQVGCGSTTAPSSVTVTVPGWSSNQLGPPFGTGPLRTVPYVMIAPDTFPVTITVTWSGTLCEIGTSVLADEFSGVYTAGGVLAVPGGGSSFADSMGDCNTTFGTVVASEAIWAACFSSGAVSTVGPGYTRGADNGGGDAAEYRIATDPAGASEMPSFSNNSAFVMDAIGLRPQ